MSLLTEAQRTKKHLQKTFESGTFTEFAWFKFVLKNLEKL